VIKGRLEGWIRNSKEVIDEFDCTEEEADILLLGNAKINANPLLGFQDVDLGGEK
jgi:hypothetical protein